MSKVISLAQEAPGFFERGTKAWPNLGWQPWWAEVHSIFDDPAYLMLAPLDAIGTAGGDQFEDGGAMMRISYSTSAARIIKNPRAWCRPACGGGSVVNDGQITELSGGRICIAPDNKCHSLGDVEVPDSLEVNDLVRLHFKVNVLTQIEPLGN